MALIIYGVTYEIGWKRTIVGYYNVRFLNDPAQSLVNVSPEAFTALIPGVDPRANAGRLEVDTHKLESIGFTVALERGA